jgi:hypothetical protein
MPKTIVVSGALANRPGNGGGAWVRLSWVNGLRRLGFRVHFIDVINKSSSDPAAAEGWGFFFHTCSAAFGLESDDETLVYGDGPDTFGARWATLLDIAESAELLVNIGGHLTLEPLLKRFRRTAYIDLDPGFTQFWHSDPHTNFRVPLHDSYYTIAANIGRAGCEIPVGDIPWRTMRPPVVLDDWPAYPPNSTPFRFTTVASWRGAFGPVTYGGKTYGVKAHEFRKFVSLPQRAPVAQFQLAMDIHPDDAKDVELLRTSGWTLTDPEAVARFPIMFWHYVYDSSSAEFSVAQGIYVDTNSGWFSDRTVRYLASGRPALVQDTGFSRTVPAGEGLVAFRTIEEAVLGVKRIGGDFAAHCQAARHIAEECFDSDKVLGRFLDEVGVHP